MLARFVLVVIIASMPGIVLELRQSEIEPNSIQITPELRAYGPGKLK